MAFSKVTWQQSLAWCCIAVAGVCLAAPFVSLALRKAVVELISPTPQAETASPLAASDQQPPVDSDPASIDHDLARQTTAPRGLDLTRFDTSVAPATEPTDVASPLRATPPQDVIAAVDNITPLPRRSAEDSREVSPTTPRESKIVTEEGAVRIPRQPLEGPTTAFAERDLRRSETPAGAPGNGLGKTAVRRAESRRPEPAVEAAVSEGLKYLARMQQADGGWALRTAGDDQPCVIESRSAATGLALMSFLGAGFHHRQGGYAHEVKQAIDFLSALQQEDGLIPPGDNDPQGPVVLYGHAIATIALCEAYGMTADPELQPIAQQAIDYVTKSQHPTLGGWRYRPGLNSDTSVSGWMLTALHSARLAGLRVTPLSVENAEQWFEGARVAEQPYLFCYNPLAPETPSQQRGRDANAGMTAVGLLMRLYLGDQRDHSDLAQGSEFLLDQFETFVAEDDVYFWYYATQVMLHVRGERWDQWNRRLTPLLVDRQQAQGALAGSWSPQGDRWGPHAGRLYTTTLNLLTLEVYYRHLPLYEIAWSNE